MVNHPHRWRLLAVLALAVPLLVLGACSDDDDDGIEAGGSDQTVPDEMGATGAAAEWCDEVINVDQERLSQGLAVDGAADAAAFSQVVTSLAATAPDEMIEPIQTLSTISTSLVEQGDPDATLAPAEATAFTEAAAEVQTWVRDNCGGYELQI
jgi:hypothetical protein